VCGRAVGRGLGCGGEKNAEGISLRFWGRGKRTREGVVLCFSRGEKDVPLGVMVREVKVVPFVGEAEGSGRSWRDGVEKMFWGASVKWPCLGGERGEGCSFCLAVAARVGGSQSSTAVEACDGGGLNVAVLREDAC